MKRGSFHKNVATNFHHCTSLCAICHASAFFPCFLPLTLACWQPPFNWGHFLWGFNKRLINWRAGCISQVLCHVFVGFPSYFYKDMTVRYSSSAVDCFVKADHMFFCAPLVQLPRVFFKGTVHTRLRYSRFLANSSLDFIVLAHKYFFCLSNWVICANFHIFKQINGNKMFCDLVVSDKMSNDNLNLAVWYV